MEITVEDFDKVDVRVGTIVAVEMNKKACLLPTSSRWTWARK